MRRLVVLFILLLVASSVFSQKLISKSGLVIGVQKGTYNGFELGYEKQWKQLKLVKPKTIGFTANGEYLFKGSAFGAKAGPWVKFGKSPFTYGANVVAGFKENKPELGFAPTVGVKFFGLHGIASYNIFPKASSEFDYNRFNLSLRLFIVRDRNVMRPNALQKKEWF